MQNEDQPKRGRPSEPFADEGFAALGSAFQRSPTSIVQGISSMRACVAANPLSKFAR
jgi:hypothetical protein